MLPSAALRVAARELQSSQLGGSTTVLLGNLCPEGKLRLLNIGDSGALLLRPSRRRFGEGHRARTMLWPRIVVRSHDQTHYFNCPYQVGAEDIEATLDSSADEVEAVAREGDVLIAATDGVLDNLFEDDISAIVAAHVPKLRKATEAGAAAGSLRAALHTLAKNLAAEAVRVGKLQDDAEVRSPFTAAAEREGYLAPGGKLDDVALVCGAVVSARVAAEQRVDDAAGLVSNFGSAPAQSKL